MSSTLAFFKRDLLIFFSYKLSFMMQILGVFFVVPFFFFISKVMGDSTSDMLKNYGGNYFAFLLIGVAFVDYLGLSLKTFNDSIRDSQLMGTMEIVLLSPTTLPEILISSSLFGYCFTTSRFVLYLLLGLCYGLDLGKANFISGFLILLLSVIAFASIGILIACATMIFKQCGSLNHVVNATALFLGGVIYPIDVLPMWLQKISLIFPFTHSLQAIRLALIDGAGLWDLKWQICILLAFIIVLLPVSLMTFWASVRWTKMAGTLAQY
jgi:ABC-2 type transport system permease protein